MVAVFVLYVYSSARVINLSVADLGRHIKNGEIIVSTGAIPRTNLFSYTHPDFPFVNHHWAVGVIYYFVHEWSGFAGLRLLNMALELATVGLMFGLAWRSTRCELAVLAAILCEPLIGSRCEVRPEYFSNLFMALFVFLLWQYRQNRLSGRWLLVLPVVELVWVNLHLFFPFGPLLVGFFLVDNLWPRARGAIERQWPRVWLLVGVLLACVGATLVNPWGVEGALYPFLIFRNYGIAVGENLPTLPYLFVSPEGLHFAFVFLLTLLGVGWTVFAPERGDRRLPLLLITLAFGLLAWQHYRAMAIFGYLALAVLPLSWDRAVVLRFVDSLGQRRAVMGLLGFAALYCAVRPEPWIYRDSPGLGLEEGSMDGLKFFRENKLHGPIFNTFDIGNYLIFGLYPEERVFVDGRPEAYPASFFQKSPVPMQGVRDDEDQWNALLDHYKFNVLVLHSLEIQRSQAYGSFLRRRVADPHWATVFLDRRMVILVRRTPEHKDLIDRFQVDFR
jgi:hypothetical protein